LKYDIIAW